MDLPTEISNKNPKLFRPIPRPGTESSVDRITVGFRLFRIRDEQSFAPITWRACYTQPLSLAVALRFGGVRSSEPIRPGINGAADGPGVAANTISFFSHEYVSAAPVGSVPKAGGGSEKQKGEKKYVKNHPEPALRK